MRVSEGLTPTEELRRILPKLSDRLRDAARYLTEHEFDATTRSMRDLATSARLQPVAFTRLAQAMGRKGWEEFRDELIEARRPRIAGPYSSRATRSGAGKWSRDDPISLVGAIAMADAEALNALEMAPVAKAICTVHRAQRVWVAGFRSCRSVADLIHYQLRLFRDDVRLIGAVGSEDLDFGEFREGDAVVTISFAPYSRAGLSTLREARKAGCTLVSITDQVASPYAEGAHHVLFFNAASTPAFFPSLTGAICVAQALVAGVFKLGGDRSDARLRKSENRLLALQQYMPDEARRRRPRAT